MQTLIQRYSYVSGHFGTVPVNGNLADRTRHHLGFLGHYPRRGNKKKKDKYIKAENAHSESG
ncbi:hypothetical protein GCM10010967_15390 [Dyadobacter beijingensis]|uniref:Uncharacterized protein n=1 Tax=Dyadobacter beijingensis TaxID=365489 RepID=A0ABQ2HMB7_9BACT|nr:hypothetical protein GCM10010967_15390 [Dyadobacter beijingensis]